MSVLTRSFWLEAFILLHTELQELCSILEMRALAALAALHVILACPDGECDDVEMLQSSMGHMKESAAIQLSAMVHGGKHKEPEAEQSAESAQSPQPASEKSPKSAAEKARQSAKEKKAEEQKQRNHLSFGSHSDCRYTLIHLDDDR